MHEAQAQVGKTNIDRLVKALQEAAEKKIGIPGILYIQVRSSVPSVAQA